MHFARKPVNRLQGSGREVLGAVYIYIYICYIYVYMQEHTRSRPPVCIYARWGRGKANKNAYAVNQICMCTGGRSKKRAPFGELLGGKESRRTDFVTPTGYSGAPSITHLAAKSRWDSSLSGRAVSVVSQNYCSQSWGPLWIGSGLEDAIIPTLKVGFSLADPNTCLE